MACRVCWSGAAVGAVLEAFVGRGRSGGVRFPVALLAPSSTIGLEPDPVSAAVDVDYRDAHGLTLNARLTSTAPLPLSASVCHRPAGV